MNVSLIYFSLTGNTRLVAEAMAEAFRDNGHLARTVSLKRANPQELVRSDLLGVGTPCHSSQAPTPVKAFLQSLPPLRNTRAFVFATTGGAPGRVLFDLSQLLLNKGAEVIGSHLTRGEVHHPAPCLKGRFPNRPNAEDLAGTRRFATAISEHAAGNQPGSVVGSYQGTIRPTERFYNAVALISTDSFVRRFLPEPKLEPALCDRCQWCVYACPMHNITLRPYPALGQQCVRCYRCLTGCPQKAFDADWRLSNLGIWFFYNTTFERWFGDVKPGESIY